MLLRTSLICFAVNTHLWNVCPSAPWAPTFTHFIPNFTDIFYCTRMQKVSFNGAPADKYSIPLHLSSESNCKTIFNFLPLSRLLVFITIHKFTVDVHHYLCVQWNLSSLPDGAPPAPSGQVGTPALPLSLLASALLPRSRCVLSLSHTHTLTLCVRRDGMKGSAVAVCDGPDYGKQPQAGLPEGPGFVASS